MHTTLAKPQTSSHGPPLQFFIRPYFWAHYDPLFMFSTGTKATKDLIFLSSKVKEVYCEICTIVYLCEVDQRNAESQQKSQNNSFWNTWK